MMDALNISIGPIAAFAAIGLVMFGFMIGRSRRQLGVQTTNDWRDALESRLLGVEQKVSKISMEIQHLPTSETIQGMAIKIADIGGDVKALQSSVLATNRLVERIDRWLLEEVKK